MLRGVLEGDAALPRNLVALVIDEFRERGRRRPPLKRRGVVLTDREWEVLELTSHGLSTLEIAERLFIEPGTVRTHVSAILKKLHALNGSLPGDWPNTTNTAIASWSAQQLASDGDLAAGSADFTVPVSSTENPTDNCADVTDSIAGDLSGGNVCVGDPGDVNGTFTFQYQWTFYGPAAGTCATIPNTATFADNSIPQSTGSAGASVRLCSFSARLTPGY